MGKSRKEREAEILKEMDEAMAQEKTAEETAEEKKEKYKLYGIFEDTTPETLHCPKCKTELQKGVCPTCGYRTYIPIDEKKRKKIRWIITGVCVVATVVILLLLQLK